MQLSPERVFSFLNLNLRLGDFEAFILGERFLFLSDFDAIKEVLQRRPKTFRRSVFFERFAIEYKVTHGLLNAEGDVWGRVRRLVSPSFSAKHLISMFSVITDKAKILLDGFAAHANSGSALDVSPLFHEYVSRTMYGLIFGDVAKQIDYMKSNQICTDVTYVMNSMYRRTVTPLPANMWFLVNDELERNARAAAARMEDAAVTIFEKAMADKSLRVPGLFLDTLMTAVLDDQESSSSSPSASVPSSSSSSDARGRSKLSMEEMTAQIKSILVAGTDTSTSLLCSTCVLLGAPENAALQEEVFAEVLKAMGQARSVTKLEELENMPLLECVLKEANRLRGPVPLQSFNLADDLPDFVMQKGYAIRRGDNIVLNIYAAVRNEDVYKNAASFDPKRWLPSHTPTEQLARMNEHFLAFGHGPRVCPGMKLASLETQCAMANLLRSYRLELGCDLAEINWLMAFTAHPDKAPLLLQSR
jgi:cytochrome P450